MRKFCFETRLSQIENIYSFVKYMIISRAHVAYFHDFDLFFSLSVSCFERFIYSCFLICICRLIYSFCCIANKCLFKWGKYKKRCLTQNLCMIQLDVKESRFSHLLLFDLASCRHCSNILQGF